MSFQKQTLQPEETPRLMRAIGHAFGVWYEEADLEQVRQMLEPTRFRVAVDDGEIIGTFGSYELQLSVPGGRVAASGVSMVTVVPTHRRRGVLTDLMREHFPIAKERGEIVAVLWASESHIYHRFGFGIGSFRDHVRIEKRVSRLEKRIDFQTDNLSLKFVDKAEALRRFPAIYERCFQTRPGFVSRTPAWWEWRILGDLAHKRGSATPYRHVILQRDGEDVGYVVFVNKNPHGIGSMEVHIIELMGIDGAAERALWAFVLDLDLSNRLEASNQPIDAPVYWMLAEPRRMERTRLDTLWVKVLAVEGALSSRRYAYPGRLVFSLEDEFFAENSGCYELLIDELGVGRCQRTDQPATIALTSRTLGSLYLGSVCVWELSQAGMLHGEDEALRLADQMFRWRVPAYCPHIF